jgi:hypothetical protein
MTAGLRAFYALLYALIGTASCTEKSQPVDQLSTPAATNPSDRITMSGIDLDRIERQLKQEDPDSPDFDPDAFAAKVAQKAKEVAKADKIVRTNRATALHEFKRGLIVRLIKDCKEDDYLAAAAHAAGMKFDINDYATIEEYAPVAAALLNNAIAARYHLDGHPHQRKELESTWREQVLTPATSALATNPRDEDALYRLDRDICWILRCVDKELFNLRFGVTTPLTPK